MVIELLTTYPYLITSLGMLVGLGAAMAFCWSSQRKLAVLSGLLGTPLGFASVLVVPSYWTPQRVCEFLGAGIEDLIFSFAVGGIAWLCASCPWRRRMEVQIHSGHMLKWYGVPSLFGLSFVLIVQALGCDPMAGILVTFVIGAAVSLSLNPSLWPMAAAGGLGFALAYVIVVRVSLLAAPHFLLEWNLAGFWGQTVLGVPLGEIIWAASYGTAWPLFLARMFQARISR